VLLWSVQIDTTRKNRRIIIKKKRQGRK
jgi:hypothetical protein